ncbi:Paternally expressed 10 [Rhizoctonia solani]|uniref:Paternally expressed 10 n=1 Tax=Rhizoctonia solani TaxID=456999 RepID=A0A8H7IDD6_9AGAM|nr:Paternally expressed 10 [Rhizoctonia solani]
MATCSRSSTCPQSPLDQGELGPTLLATAVESTDLEPEVYGEVSLSQAISLILGLQNQVLRLKQELKETKEAAKEAQDWMGAVNQALTCIEARGGAPHTPEDRKPPACAPHCLGQPYQSSPTFAQPTPVRAPLRSYTPPPPLPIQLRSPQIPQPAAPVTAYQAPVKVDHPDAYTGKIGNKARQWLTRMLAWVRLNQRMFPTDQEVLLFLLMNMKDVAGAWAHPHLDQLGSHRALIQTVDKFRTEFLAAFGNPDATQAAERQITQLTQTGTCAEYITKFRTIAMDLDWNNAALCGQFARGLHWEVSRLIATQEWRPTTLLELQNAALVINNALREERTSHPPKGNKSGNSSTPIGGQVPANRPQDQGASPATPILSLRRNKTAAGLKAYASSAANQGTSLRNAALAGKPRLRRKASKISPLFTILITPEKKAEPLEVLIDSGATSSFLHPRTVESLRLPLIDLPSPCTVTMLNGSSPQAGKIWKKANLTFSFNGKRMTKTFLICNTGSHAAILGLKWLDAHNPEINWNQRTLSFPHAPPEHVAIAEEEEADQNPLEGVPSKYHQYAKVFGEEEFNKLPPHRHYDIGIELTKKAP